MRRRTEGSPRPAAPDGIGARSAPAAGTSAPTFVPERPRPPLALRAILFLVERGLGKRLVAPRILAWYPKALLGAGFMEALVAHDEPEVPRRLLALLRLYVSLRVSCPFCVDMNGAGREGLGIGEAELAELSRLAALEDPREVEAGAAEAFGLREGLALGYAAALSSTPVRFDPASVARVREAFGERGAVVLAATAAQVNFWARAIQAFGVPPAGFSGTCALPGGPRLSPAPGAPPAPRPSSAPPA